TPRATARAAGRKAPRTMPRRMGKARRPRPPEACANAWRLPNEPAGVSARGRKQRLCQFRDHAPSLSLAAYGAAREFGAQSCKNCTTPYGFRPSRVPTAPSTDETPRSRSPVNLAAAYARLPRNSRGALWMLASALCFTVMTMLIKLLGQDYPAALQTFYRQAAGLLVLTPLILRDPRAAFRTTRPGILVFRALAGTVGLILAFYSYQMMPLADANALSFTRTLWPAPLAL